MQGFLYSLAFVAFIYTQAVLSAPGATVTGWKSKSENRPPSTDGTVFNIDGKPQYFAGTNTWWLGHLTNDADVEQAVSEIAASGLKVTRVWAFGNANRPADQTVYYQLLDNTTNTISINYGGNGIPRLDSAIRYAEKYNIKLVLPMLNNWDDLGGINTYCNYFGCNATTFYTNKGAQQAYRNWIEFVIKRYQNSPAIFSWELCNEPRCHGCSDKVITNWATSTSAFIKSLDGSHMVTLGDEGWLCGGGDGSYAYSCLEGVNFEANLAIPTLDYGTFHQYPDSWGYNYSWGNEWIQQHSVFAKKHRKPIVLEEYGVVADVSNRTAVMKEYEAAILASDIAYDGFWQFGTNFSDGNKPFDSYTAYYGTEYYNETVIAHVKEMQRKKVA